MDPGQVGAVGGSVAKHAEKDGGRETVSVHLLCMGGNPVLGKRMRLMYAGLVAAVVRITKRKDQWLNVLR